MARHSIGTHVAAVISRTKSSRSAADTWSVRISVLMSSHTQAMGDVGARCSPAVILSLAKCKARVKSLLEQYSRLIVVTLAHRVTGRLRSRSADAHNEPGGTSHRT